MSESRDGLPNGQVTETMPEEGVVHRARTIEELNSGLEQLREQHTKVTEQLDASIASHEELLRQVRRLDISRARLGSLATSTRSISNGMLSGAASTAKRISSAVEKLDLEQNRVKDTLKVVEQVAELKSCVLGVVGSMNAQDWETAAEYINRASRIPDHVIDSGFAEQVVPTAETPDAPRVTLGDAAQSLCTLFLREFEKAVEEGNGAKITRFFKMFPLIGRSKEGLDAYGRYVCQGVALRARGRLQTGPGSNHRDGIFYVTAITKLFEHIAQVVDGHSPLVEQHYGTGTMVKVMQRLHREADIQGGIILDTWSDERTIDRKLTDVKSYAYSFLVQSFLPAQKSFTGTPRTQSPAAGASANNASQAGSDDSIDIKEVDKVLSEAGTMLGHWSLYLRFIASRSATDGTDEANGKDASQLTSPPFIVNSNLPKKVAKTLVEPFNTFATFFLRRSVERAFQMDEMPSGLTLGINKTVSTNPPFITSSVDDVMYIVNQVLQRALATSQASIVTGVSTMLGRVLGSDFIGMIQRRMRDESYPKANVQGAPPPDDKVISFLVLMNNLDLATDYIKRIVRTHRDDVNGQNGHADGDANPALDELFPMDDDAVGVRTALRNLENGFSAKAMELVNDGLSVAFQQVVKVRMRPLLTEAFRETDYSVSDSAFYEARQNDMMADEDGEFVSVKARFQRPWESIMRPMKRIMTERNFERLLTMTLSNLSNLLERRIWSYYARISEPGAVALEKDMADIVHVVVRGETFKQRETFNKCLQIVTIMNLEDDEWDAIKDGGDDIDADWVLNYNERHRARNIVRGRD